MMFSTISKPLGPYPTSQSSEPGRPREIPPATPVNFPKSYPKASDRTRASDDSRPIVDILREIQRPADVRIRHLEELGLHVITDASPEDIIPDSSFLPPQHWLSMPAEQVDDADAQTLRPLNNGRQAPGLKIYRERVKELSNTNAAAFRTVRRLPTPAGEPAVRLGNAYEFFKNLELVAGYWIDTTQPELEQVDENAMDVDPENLLPTMASSRPSDFRQRTSSGNTMPADFRNCLLTSLTKLVAYDFGCNVSLPRVEPRFYITSKTPSAPHQSRTSSFPSHISFIHRTPTDRAAARTGIVEGPIAALSPRPSTGFKTQLEEVLDIARETIALLITAQLRAREGTTERKHGDGMWWCTIPRWGGGTGGPIGREAPERYENDPSYAGQPPPKATVSQVAKPSSRDVLRDMVLEMERDGGVAAASIDEEHVPLAKKVRKTMPAYDAYRMIRPPSSTWDRKARYSKIGAISGSGYDDVFLLSCVNHHVSVIRTRVGERLLEQLDGAPGPRDRLCMWRSRWYDLFVPEDRVEAMTCIWGMVVYQMRKVEEVKDVERAGRDVSCR